MRQAACRRVVLRRAWQLNVCALAINLLCCGPLAATTNKMLQPSADRIDSKNVVYDDANMQITHLACNWAKNKYGLDAFSDWLSIVRDVRETENLVPGVPPEAA